MQNDFCIPLRCEVMAALQERIAQGAEVIDLPIENHRFLLVLGQNRLPTSGNINNAQTSMPKTQWTIQIEAMVIWATMAQYRAHTLELFWGNRARQLRIPYASYAAHTYTLLSATSVVPHMPLRRIEEQTKPHLEHNQTPDPDAIITLPRSVMLEEAL